jgi:hypothetical protein
MKRFGAKYQDEALLDPGRRLAEKTAETLPDLLMKQ